MDKKLFDLLDSMQAKKIEIQDLVKADQLEDAEKAKEELKDMQKQFDILKDVVDVEPVEDKVEEIKMGATPINIEKKDATHDFAEAARHGFATNAMSEGVDANGGYTVPEDIQTKINHYREADISLQAYAETINVSTDKGATTYMAKANYKGFTAVEELAEMTEADAPEFERVTWDITDYAGYIPVSNNLLNDSDAKIESELVTWLGKQDVATRNKLILEQLATLSATDLKDVAGIKKAINVTLGQAYAPTSKIYTNDDGLNYLDTLVDGQGRPLLSPSMADPMQMVLAVGARRVPIVVIPNDVLATASNAIPFIVGDLAEAVKVFDRQKITLATATEATVGGKSLFLARMKAISATDRLDVQLADKNAIVYGTITAAQG